MKNLNEKVFGNVKVIQRSFHEWGVTDLEDNIIVPFGKYDWIDGFDHGFARVKIGQQPNNLISSNKWGIINEAGEEVLKPVYDSVWNFFKKGRSSTTIEKDGVRSQFYFDEQEEYNTYNSYKEHNDYGTHYGEFAGSYAQDVMGYSDDVINDAFEGDSDNYWNID